MTTNNAINKKTDVLTISPVGTAAGNTGEVRFFELAASGNDYTGFKAPDTLVAPVMYTLPVADGSNGQVLSTNGAGQLIWVNQGGGGGNTLASMSDVAFSGLAAGDAFYALTGTIWSNTTPDTDSLIAAYNADRSLTDTAETRSASINMADNVIERAYFRDVAETKNDVVAAATTTLDITTGNVFYLTHGTDITTLNFSNPSATGKHCMVKLVRIKDNSGTTRSITWPASVKWAAGTAPTLTQTANAVDILVFRTVDGGTTWYGFASALNLS